MILFADRMHQAHSANTAAPAVWAGEPREVDLGTGATTAAQPSRHAHSSTYLWKSQQTFATGTSTGAHLSRSSLVADNAAYSSILAQADLQQQQQSISTTGMLSVTDLGSLVPRYTLDAAFFAGPSAGYVSRTPKNEIRERQRILRRNPIARCVGCLNLRKQVSMPLRR